MEAIQLNGGLGRIVSALPALTQRDDIVITNGWEELFKMTTLRTIEATSGACGHYLQECDIITPEPYHLNKVRNGEWSLAEGFHHLLGTDPSKGGGLYPAMDNMVVWSKHFNAETELPLAVIQVHGSGDFNPRDLSEGTTTNAIAAAKEAGYYPVIIGSESLGFEIDCKMITNSTVTDLVSVIAQADIFIGGDSSGSHIASVLDKKAVYILTATAGQNNAKGNFSKLTPEDITEIKSYPRFFTEERNVVTRQTREGVHRVVYSKEDIAKALTTLMD